jgi:hypothetical protein
MRTSKLQTTRLGVICALLLTAMLAGCETLGPKVPDVGAVVRAPDKDLGQVPLIVQQTPPKAAGYFQRSLLDDSSSESSRPTPSIAPTQPAASTPTR